MKKPQNKLSLDLHNHWIVGFQDYWQRRQLRRGSVFNAGVCRCFDTGLDIVAVTSDEDDIPRKSIHDRFYQLVEQSGKANKLFFQSSLMDKNVLVVENKRSGKRVYIVNGQTVRVNENGKKIDYLVFGANDIPNGKSLDYTIKYCADRGLLTHGPEHPICVAHGGIGEERLVKLLKGKLDEFDFIETRNLQLRWSDAWKYFPVAGMFLRSMNDRADAIAAYYGKPGIETSDAHTIRQMSGEKGIYVDVDKIDPATEAGFLASINNSVKKGDFMLAEGKYTPAFQWLGFTAMMAKGKLYSKLSPSVFYSERFERN